MGTLILTTCPADTIERPDGPFALSYSYCGVARSPERMYQAATVLTVLLVFRLGPLIGGLLTFMWWVAGLACLFAAGRHLLQALARVTVERL